MKSKTSLIIAVFIFVLFAVAVFFRRLRKVKIHDIRSFSITYTCGSFEFAERCFKLTVKEGIYIAGFKDAGVPDTKIRTVNVHKDFVRRLEEILNRNKVTSWDRFNKVNRRASVTERFDLEIYDVNGSAVSAHGNGKMPRKFETLKKELEALFFEVFEDTEKSIQK